MFQEKNMEEKNMEGENIFGISVFKLLKWICSERRTGDIYLEDPPPAKWFSKI